VANKLILIEKNVVVLVRFIDIVYLCCTHYNYINQML